MALRSAKSIGINGLDVRRDEMFVQRSRAFGQRLAQAADFPSSPAVSACGTPRAGSIFATRANQQGSSVLAPVLIIAGLIAATIAIILRFILPLQAERRIVFAADPDAPRSFGLDMAWIAVKTEDTGRLATLLGLEAANPANWNAGVGTIYDSALSDSYVFVCPPVKGWTLIAGVPLPLAVGRAFTDKLTPVLTALAAEFREVQYFASYQIIDYFAWVRFTKGKAVRAFAIGDEGVIWDRGRLTPEERALGLKLFELRGIRGRKGDTGEAIILHPTEEQVLRMACGWSLDPSRLDRIQGAVPGTGFVARAPAAWRPERIRRAA